MSNLKAVMDGAEQLVAIREDIEKARREQIQAERNYKNATARLEELENLLTASLKHVHSISGSYYDLRARKKKVLSKKDSETLMFEFLEKHPGHSYSSSEVATKARISKNMASTLLREHAKKSNRIERIGKGNRIKYSLKIN